MQMRLLIIVFGLIHFTQVAFSQNKDKSLVSDVGIVSYTYRNSFQKDVAATLDTIKGLGFNHIEFSNLFGKTAEEIRKLLDDRNMTCTSFGVSYDDLVSKIEEVAQKAKTLGSRYVRVAWIPHDTPFTLEHIKKAVEDFNKAGKLLKEQHGLTFCYHNHGYEFQPYENGTLFDYLVKNTEPVYVSFEMDILWVAHPGHDPVALLKKYGDRFKLMHVKDLKKGVKSDYTGKTDVTNDVALGEGQLNIPAVLKAAKKSAIAYYYIEDESPYISEQVPQSLAYLKNLKE
jgi:sugar phosphate isomerase/epimerase